MGIKTSRERQTLNFVSIGSVIILLISDAITHWASRHDLTEIADNINYYSKLLCTLFVILPYGRMEVKTLYQALINISILYLTLAILVFAIDDLFDCYFKSKIAIILLTGSLIINLKWWIFLKYWPWVSPPIVRFYQRLFWTRKR